jgi:predicted Zn-dependent protease
MYVNRGMIQAATAEGEVAGVVAHELSPHRRLLGVEPVAAHDREP